MWLAAGAGVGSGGAGYEAAAGDEGVGGAWVGAGPEAGFKAGLLQQGEPGGVAEEARLGAQGAGLSGVEILEKAEDEFGVDGYVERRAHRLGEDQVAARLQPLPQLGQGFLQVPRHVQHVDGVDEVQRGGPLRRRELVDVQLPVADGQVPARQPATRPVEEEGHDLAENQFAVVPLLLAHGRTEGGCGRAESATQFQHAATFAQQRQQAAHQPDVVDLVQAVVGMEILLP